MSDHMMRELDATSSPECEAIEARLADYLDDAPDPAVVAEVDAHLAHCPRCAALVADIGGIAASARALPPIEPPRDLWAGIAERIDAAAPAVVPIETARRRYRWVLPAQWRSLGAAAAALVLITAGVTYEVTKLSMHGGGGGAAIEVATGNAHGGNDSAAAPTTTGPATSGEVAASTTTTEPASTTTTEPASTTTTNPASSLGGGIVRSVRNENRRSAAGVKSTYDTEIESLRRIVRDRRAEIDPKTLAVLERNIQVIDDAIAQSRAALAHDPRSRFLNEQLDDALDKKLELLRTAALLPARS